MFGDAARIGGNAALPASKYGKNRYLINPVTFVDNGVFYPVPGVTRYYVQVWGAGGGGSRGNTNSTNGLGGAGGGYAAGYVDLPDPNAPVTVTVGKGGLAGLNASAGVDGGTSSFGAYLTATGGGGGGYSVAQKGAAVGGTGSVGAGVTGGTTASGVNGTAVEGSGGGAGANSGGAGGAAGNPATCGLVPGGGGGGGNASGTSPGANGASGQVIITW